MADLHWTSITGIVTGAIGSATGIAGAILGYLGYKKSKQIKALDLRIESKRAVTDTIVDFEKLREQMKKGNESRKAVAAAMGFFSSSAMNQWKEEFASDQKAVRVLTKELPYENSNYDDLDEKGLENKLIESHRIQRKIQ